MLTFLKVKKLLRFPSLQWATIAGDEVSLACVILVCQPNPLVRDRSSPAREAAHSRHMGFYFQVSEERGVDLHACVEYYYRTKTKERYRTPKTIEKLKERARYQEILQVRTSSIMASTNLN